MDRIDRYYTKQLLNGEMDFGDWLFDILSRREWLNGHISFHIPFFGNDVTVWGANAMWFSINVHTMRYGYICFRPPLFVKRFPWNFYFSPDGTPNSSTFFRGGGDWRNNRKKSRIRYLSFGHNFNTDENRQELNAINGVRNDDGY